MSPSADRPDLRQLRIQAKELVREVRAGNPASLARVVPYIRSTSEFTLANAQLVIAREHGFDSWPKLKRDLERGPDKKSKSPTTLFFEALESRDDAAVIEMLASNPELAAASRRTDYGWSTALHVAAVKGSLESVKALVEAGAEIYAVNQGGYPPVFDAIYDKRKEIVDYLFQASAERDHGIPPTYGCGIDIVLAGRVGMLDRIRMHVEKDPFAVFRRGCIGESVLHWPSHNGHTDIVSFLLVSGALIEADEIGLYGGKPLHWASEHSPRCVELLLSRGANPMSRNHKVNEFEGYTPLHMWARQREELIECAELLLDAGADPNAVDARGHTPLEVAESNNRHRSAQFLKDRQ